MRRLAITTEIVVLGMLARILIALTVDGLFFTIALTFAAAENIARPHVNYAKVCAAIETIRLTFHLISQSYICRTLRLRGLALGERMECIDLNLHFGKESYDAYR